MHDHLMGFLEKGISWTNSRTVSRLGPAPPGCQAITEASANAADEDAPAQGTRVLTVSIPTILGAIPVPTPKLTASPTATPTPDAFSTRRPPDVGRTKDAATRCRDDHRMGAKIHIKGPTS